MLAKTYKIFFVLLMTCPFYFVSFETVYAQNRFEVDADVEYKISDSGRSTVTNTISIKNISSETLAKSFRLALSDVNPINIKAFEGADPLEVIEDKEGENRYLTVNFEELVAGIDRSKTFIISFDEDTLAQKTGGIWEISIPKLTSSSNFSTYDVRVSVPETFGEEAYVTPDPSEKIIKNGSRIYKFHKGDVENSEIVAAFGEFQVFAYKLNYYLTNPDARDNKVDIAIPPDTSTQKLYYDRIDPSPENVTIDADGNWIASYELTSREKVTVVVSGAVQVFSTPRKFLTPKPSNLLTNLKPSNFWQTGNDQIMELAGELKTAGAIYNYVTGNLSYDVTRVKPSATRLGAIDSLKNPINATCTEFTDTFIAIARAAGIPAREINGFAYSENRELQPLSLVSDVLHAWPEYWSNSKSNWIPVDPTWGSTTGRDFFNEFDLKHFTFVIHGEDPEKPYAAGSYKSPSDPKKDVFVTPGSLPGKRGIDIEIKPSGVRGGLFKSQITFRLTNRGATAPYDVNTEIFFDGNRVASNYIEGIPPYGFTESRVSIPIGFLAKDTPSEILVKSYGSEFRFPINKKVFIVNQLVALSLILAVVIILVLTKTGGLRRIFFQ